MATAKAKVGVNPSDFAGINSLALTVIAGLTANANFLVPNPSIAFLSASQISLAAAIAVWGPVGNRGSHGDYVDLVQKAHTMRDLLLAEADYVTNIATTAHTDYPTQAAVIATSGFGVKNLPTPQGVLGPPIGLARRMSDAISEDDIALDWKKPIGLNSPNNVKNYKVYMDGNLLSTSTKTYFLVTMFFPIAHGNVYNFEVRGTNSAGDGVMSAVLIINF